MPDRTPTLSSLAGSIRVPSGDELPSIRTDVPGAGSRGWCDRLAEVECPALTMRRARRAEASGAAHDPIVWVAARGANVTDADGNVFVDFTAGFGAALLGHSNPSVVAAVQRQAARMCHALGDVHPSVEKIALESKLAEMAPWPSARVILGLSGSDAVEAALKTAWLATSRSTVIVFDSGYHGLSLGTMSLSAFKPAMSTPFSMALQLSFEVYPYPRARDAATPRTVASIVRRIALGDVAAVLVEPIAGRGGVFAADLDALDALIDVCRTHSTLVIADEIMTGMRRASSREWTYSQAEWRRPPDIVCLGKALGGGVPVSACVIRSDLARAWGDPSSEAIHTSTFLGNPLACAAALAAIGELSTPEMLAMHDRVSTHLASALVPLAADSQRFGVADVSAHGLLIGVHLEGGAQRALRVARVLLQNGYITLTAGSKGDCLSLTPPITVTDEQCDGFAHALGAALDQTAGLPAR